MPDIILNSARKIRILNADNQTNDFCLFLSQNAAECRTRDKQQSNIRYIEEKIITKYESKSVGQCAAYVEHEMKLSQRNEQC